MFIRPSVFFVFLSVCLIVCLSVYLSACPQNRSIQKFCPGSEEPKITIPIARQNQLLSDFDSPPLSPIPTQRLQVCHVTKVTIRQQYRCLPLNLKKKWHQAKKVSTNWISNWACRLTPKRFACDFQEFGLSIFGLNGTHLYSCRGENLLLSLKTNKSLEFCNLVRKAISRDRTPDQGSAWQEKGCNGPIWIQGHRMEQKRLRKRTFFCSLKVSSWNWIVLSLLVWNLSTAVTFSSDDTLSGCHRNFGDFSFDLRVHSFDNLFQTQGPWTFCIHLRFTTFVRRATVVFTALQLWLHHFKWQICHFNSAIWYGNEAIKR